MDCLFWLIENRIAASGAGFGVLFYDPDDFLVVFVFFENGEHFWVIRGWKFVLGVGFFYESFGSFSVTCQSRIFEQGTGKFYVRIDKSRIFLRFGRDDFGAGLATFYAENN